MLFDKLRNRYSFNFLAICGWITFFLYIPFLYPPYMTNPQIGGPFALILILNTIINFIFCITSIFIYLIEFMAKKQITNQKFLNSKFVFYLQIFGILFFLVPFAIMLYVII